jgi:site-specific DNA recombinase
MALRAVIYTRLASVRQHPDSINDQIEVCRHYIETQGWQLAGTYDDPSISGHGLMRPSYQRLIHDAEAGAFDVVVVASLNRISRSHGDLAQCHEQLTSLDIQLHEAGFGHMTPMHVALIDMMRQIERADHAAKTKRGMRAASLANSQTNFPSAPTPSA